MFVCNVRSLWCDQYEKRIAVLGQNEVYGAREYHVGRIVGGRGTEIQDSAIMACTPIEVTVVPLSVPPSSSIENEPLVPPRRGCRRRRPLDPAITDALAI